MEILIDADHLPDLGGRAFDSVTRRDVGQRRNEIITLTWEMVDWQHSCFHFPDTKTGQRSAPVSSEAMALLREIHDATGNPRRGLVLRGRNGGKLTRVNDTWNRIRTAIGIALAIVGEMLGHKQVNTTKRYAHLSDQAVRSALETTARRIAKVYKEPGRGRRNSGGGRRPRSCR